MTRSSATSTSRSLRPISLWTCKLITANTKIDRKQKRNANMILRRILKEAFFNVQSFRGGQDGEWSIILSIEPTLTEGD